MTVGTVRFTRMMALREDMGCRSYGLHSSRLTIAPIAANNKPAMMGSPVPLQLRADASGALLRQAHCTALTSGWRLPLGGSNGYDSYSRP